MCMYPLVYPNPCMHVNKRMFYVSMSVTPNPIVHLSTYASPGVTQFLCAYIYACLYTCLYLYASILCPLVYANPFLHVYVYIFASGSVFPSVPKSLFACECVCTLV